MLRRCQLSVQPEEAEVFEQWLLDHAFNTLDLRRIEGDVDPHNMASIRLLERLGFVREGLARERWMVEGRVSDSALYGLLPSDFRKPAFTSD